jgi:large subunit ribosomal protein L10
MAISKRKKVEILDEINSQVKVQKSVVLLSTNGSENSIDSQANFEIRKKANEQGVKLRIVKNTLIQKSFENVPDLIGQTYLGYLNDPEKSDEVTVPKVLVEITAKKDYKNSLKVVGSVVNGEFLDSNDTVNLSKVPSFNDSMSMVAGSLNQVISKIALTVNEVPSGVARGVSEVSKNIKE